MFSGGVLLEDGVDGCNASGHVLLLPLAVPVAGSALGDVVEQPLVLRVVQRSGQAGGDALVAAQQRL